MNKILIEFDHPRGTVREVTLDNGEKWNLLGECNRCGECCKDVNMVLPEFQKEDGTCKHFSYESVNGEKLGACGVIWARPSFCLIYPRDPRDPLPEKCSHSWERAK